MITAHQLEAAGWVLPKGIAAAQQGREPAWTLVGTVGSPTATPVDPAGLVVGAAGAWLLGAAVPALPTHIAWSFVLLAETTAALIGLGAGVLPALAAARLDPVEALRDE